MDKKDLKIVFLGTPEFAVCSLSRLLDEGFRIEAVVTAPDKPAGRGHKMLQSDVKKFALERGLPILQPRNLKDPEFIESLKAIDADLFIVIAFRMLPEAVWQMPRLGCFNLHASLLPRYRGAAPINRAVMNGDTETGVTTFFLKHEIDTGDIISQERVEILPSDNVEDVHDRLMHLGARLTVNTVRAIADGTVTTIPQERMLTSGETPTPAPKIFKDTCRIDWYRPARQLHNHVRGLSPYPCAWTELFRNGSDTPVATLKIQATGHTGHKSCAPAGTVIAGNGTLEIVCGDGQTLEICRLQPSGKRPMEAAEFLRGARLEGDYTCR